MCDFQSLYYNDDGYVVRCKQCSGYQLAFGNSMLSLTLKDFEELYKTVKNNYDKDLFPLTEHSKCVVIPTPFYGVQLLFTKKEANDFFKILEEADTEMKTLSLLKLFK